VRAALALIAQVVARVTAGALAAASVVPIGFGSVIALLDVVIAAQRPDPTIADGDPCCAHPDTWAEVFLGIGFAVGTLVAVAATIYVAVVLAGYAADGALPARRVQIRASCATLVGGAWAAVFFLG
jgi:hypothetical protein